MRSARQNRIAGVDLLTNGDGPPEVVFLHGIGGRAASFVPLFGMWPEAAQLLAWDAPGYGGSDPLTEDTPSPAAYARRLGEALPAGPVHIVGQSLGALFVAAFAVANPERVRTLTLVCPAHGYKQPPGQLTEALKQRIADAEAHGMPAFAAARAHRLVHAPEEKPQIVAAVREAMGSLSPAGHRAAVHALAQGDLLADCAAFAGPVQVLAGAEDIITPIAGSFALYDALRARPRGPNTTERLTVIGDAGHALMQEHPAAVASAMASFMEHGR
jgi:pimeloyl-ACP methyl ester carboxylesterase